MTLTTEQKQLITEAGSIELPISSLAILLEVPFTRLEIEFHNSESEVYKLYEKSRLETNNKIILALTKKAEAGDKGALKARTEFIESINFREIRNKMFRG